MVIYSLMTGKLLPSFVLDAHMHEHGCLRTKSWMTFFPVIQYQISVTTTASQDASSQSSQPQETSTATQEEQGTSNNKGGRGRKSETANQKSQGKGADPNSRRANKKGSRTAENKDHSKQSEPAPSEPLVFITLLGNHGDSGPRQLWRNKENSAKFQPGQV